MSHANIFEAGIFRITAKSVETYKACLIFSAIACICSGENCFFGLVKIISFSVLMGTR